MCKVTDFPIEIQKSSFQTKTAKHSTHAENNSFKGILSLAGKTLTNLERTKIKSLTCRNQPLLQKLNTPKSYIKRRRDQLTCAVSNSMFIQRPTEL